jgi:hypothetical protein
MEMAAAARLRSRGRVWIISPLWLLPSLYRHPGGRFLEPTELGAEYAHWAFTKVVPFDEMEPTKVHTAVRSVPMVAMPSDAFGFCSLFLHTDSDLGVVQLVDLVWMRDTII